MTDFYNYLSTAPVKNNVVNRLSQAASSNTPDGILKKVFLSKNTQLTSLAPLLSAVSEAEKNKSKFDNWFNQVLFSACHDLLDEQGHLRSTIKELLRPSWKNLKAKNEGNEAHLLKCLVYSYCQQFVKANAGKAAPQFALWWDQRVSEVLQEKFELKDFIAERVELQTKRILQHWQWLHYCIKHRGENSQQLWQAAINYYHAFYHLFYLKNEIYSVEGMGTVLMQLESSKRAKQVSWCDQDQEKINQVIRELETFNELTKSGEGSCLIDKRWQKVYSSLEKRNKAEFNHSCFKDLFDMIPFFMIIGFDGIEGEHISRQTLLARNQGDYSASVLQFAADLHSNHFHVKFSSSHPKQFVKAVRAEVKKYNKEMESPHIRMDERIQLMLSMREMILYWLRIGPEVENKELNSILAECIFVLEKLDLELEKSFKLLESNSKSDDDSDFAPLVAVGLTQTECEVPLSDARPQIDSRGLSVQGPEIFEVEAPSKTCCTFFSLLVAYVLELFCGVGNLFMWLFVDAPQEAKLVGFPTTLFHYKSVSAPTMSSEFLQEGTREALAL